MLSREQINNRKVWVAELRSEKWTQIPNLLWDHAMGRCVLGVGFEAFGLRNRSFWAEFDKLECAVGMREHELRELADRNNGRPHFRGIGNELVRLPTAPMVTFAEFADELERSVVLAEAELASQEPVPAPVPVAVLEQEAVLA